MKELASNQIINADLRIKDVPKTEREDKINLLYSLGYVWDPYHKQFLNWAIDGSLKAVAIYNLSREQIIMLHEDIKSNFLQKNNKIRSISQVKQRFYGKDKISSFEANFEIFAGIVGILLSIVGAIILFISNSYILATIIATAGFVSLYYWVTKKKVQSKHEFVFGEAPLYVKYKSVFIFLKYASLVFSFYLIEKLTNSFWLPIIILALLLAILNVIIKNKLSKQYWQFKGIRDVERYYAIEGFS